MQTNLSLNFSDCSVNPSDWMWSTVFVRGERGTVVGFDAESYAEPMVRVLFGDGRIATLKPRELGA